MSKQHCRSINNPQVFFFTDHETQEGFFLNKYYIHVPCAGFEIKKKNIGNNLPWGAYLFSSTPDTLLFAWWPPEPPSLLSDRRDHH